MRTKDVLAYGIDRNFLRKCMDEKVKIISPAKEDADRFKDENYVAYNFMESDVEKVCLANIYRKMGLSFSDIKDHLDGKTIPLRESLIDLISKYEEEIEELQAIVKIMKYVKGLGFLPEPPQVGLGGKNFKEFLVNYIKYLDPEEKLNKLFDLFENINQINIVEDSLSEKEMDKKYDELMDKLVEICPLANEEEVLTMGEYTNRIENMQKEGIKATNSKVVAVIEDMYNMQKKIMGLEDWPYWDYARGCIFPLIEDSDFREVVVNNFGEEFVKYWIEALLSFAIEKDPEAVKKYFTN